MIAMSPTDAVVTFSEAEWLQFLISERRPNLLVSCASTALESAVARLTRACLRPLHTVHLPGPLDLPADLTGTLLLSDVAQLTLGQQIRLNDWMSLRHPHAQVISLTTRALLPLVEQGRFLEGLLYRINVVSLRAENW